MSLLWWLTGVCHQLSCDHLGANPQPLRHLRLQSFLGLGNEGSADPQLWTVLDHQHHLGADRGNTPHITSLLALFHCMVRHGTVRYDSLLGGFPLGTVPGTWYFFSTTSVEVPCEPYRYQNVTCKLCWSLIGRRELSLLRHWTCDTRPSSTR